MVSQFWFGFSVGALATIIVAIVIVCVLVAKTTVKKNNEE